MPQMHYIYNGQFIYNLIQKLRHTSDCITYFKKLFAPSSQITELFIDIMTRIENSLPPETKVIYLRNEPRQRKRKKKSKK